MAEKQVVARDSTKLKTPWLDNVMRSIGVTAVSGLSQLYPNLTDVTSAGVKASKSIITSIRQSKATTNRITSTLKQNKYVQLSSQAMKNALKDLKAGNLAGHESGFDDMFGGLDTSSDISFGSDDAGDEGGSESYNINVDDGTKDAVLRLNDNIRRQAENTTKIAKANMDAQISMSAASMHQLEKMSGEITAHLSNINNNLKSIVEFNNQNMNKFIDASIGYYEAMGKKSEEGSTILKNEDDPLSALRNARGGIDINRYKQVVKKQARKALENVPMIGEVISSIDDNMLEMLAENPLAMASSMISTTVTSKLLGTTLKGLETSFSNFVPVMLDRLAAIGEQEADDAAGHFKKFLAQTFGVKVNTKNSLAVAKFENKSIPFDNETKVAITEIITKELREQTQYLRIISAHYDSKLTENAKQDAEMFDYSTMKYIKVKDKRRTTADELMGNILDPLTNGKFFTEFTRTINSAGIKESDRDSIINTAKQLLKAMTESGPGLNIHDANNTQYAEAIKKTQKSAGKNNTDLVVQAFAKLAEQNPDVANQITVQLMNARKNKNKALQDMQADPTRYGLIATGDHEIEDIDEWLRQYSSLYNTKSKKNLKAKTRKKINDADFSGIHEDINYGVIGNLFAGTADTLKGSMNRLMSGPLDIRAFGHEFERIFKSGAKDIGESLKKNVFSPLKEAVLGVKDENGNYQNGLLSHVRNYLGDTFKHVKYTLIGTGYTASDGTQYSDNRDSVFGTIKRGILTKLLGPEEVDENGNPTGKRTGGLFSKFKSVFSKGLDAWKEKIIGEPLDGKSEEEIQKKIQAKLNDYSKDAAVGGAVGAGVGLFAGSSLLGTLVGGPIAGAGLGIATGILSKNERFQNWLFGEKDENGERTGGFISKGVQDYIKKHKLDIIGGGAVGLLTHSLVGKGGGLLGTLVGGPIAGAAMGIATTLIARSDKMKNFLFGNPETAQKGLLPGIRDAFKKGMGKFTGSIGVNLSDDSKILGMSGIGMLGGILASAVLPGGPIFGALIGLGASIAANASTFKKFLFGEDYVDEITGEKKHKHGLFGRVGNMINAEFLRPVKTQFVYWAKEAALRLEYTVGDTISFAAEAISEKVGGFVGSVKAKFDDALNNISGFIKNSILTPFADILNKAIVTPARKLLFGAAKIVHDVNEHIILAPFRAIKAIQFVAYNKLSEAWRNSKLKGLLDDGKDWLKTTIKNQIKWVGRRIVGLTKLALSPFKLAMKGIGGALKLGVHGIKNFIPWLNNTRAGAWLNNTRFGKAIGNFGKAVGLAMPRTQDQLDKMSRAERWRERRKQEKEERAKIKKEFKEQKIRDKNAKIIQKYTKGQYSSDTAEARYMAKIMSGGKASKYLDTSVETEDAITRKAREQANGVSLLGKSFNNILKIPFAKLSENSQITYVLKKIYDQITGADNDEDQFSDANNDELEDRYRTVTAAEREKGHQELSDIIKKHTDSEGNIDYDAVENEIKNSRSANAAGLEYAFSATKLKLAQAKQKQEAITKSAKSRFFGDEITMHGGVKGFLRHKLNEGILDLTSGIEKDIYDDRTQDIREEVKLKIRKLLSKKVIYLDPGETIVTLTDRVLQTGVLRNTDGDLIDIDGNLITEGTDSTGGLKDDYAKYSKGPREDDAQFGEQYENLSGYSNAGESNIIMRLRNRTKLSEAKLRNSGRRKMFNPHGQSVDDENNNTSESTSSDATTSSSEDTDMESASIVETITVNDDASNRRLKSIAKKFVNCNRNSDTVLIGYYKENGKWVANEVHGPKEKLDKLESYVSSGNGGGNGRGRAQIRSIRGGRGADDTASTSSDSNTTIVHNNSTVINNNAHSNGQRRADRILGQEQAQQKSLWVSIKENTAAIKEKASAHFNSWKSLFGKKGKIAALLLLAAPLIKKALDGIGNSGLFTWIDKKLTESSIGQPYTNFKNLFKAGITIASGFSDAIVTLANNVDWKALSDSLVNVAGHLADVVNFLTGGNKKEKTNTNGESNYQVLENNIKNDEKSKDQMKLFTTDPTKSQSIPFVNDNYNPKEGLNTYFTDYNGDWTEMSDAKLAYWTHPNVIKASAQLIEPTMSVTGKGVQVIGKKIPIIGKPIAKTGQFVNWMGKNKIGSSVIGDYLEKTYQNGSSPVIRSLFGTPDQYADTAKSMAESVSFSNNGSSTIASASNNEWDNILNGATSEAATDSKVIDVSFIDDTVSNSSKKASNEAAENLGRATLNATVDDSTEALSAELIEDITDQTIKYTDEGIELWSDTIMKNSDVEKFTVASTKKTLLVRLTESMRQMLYKSKAYQKLYTAMTKLFGKKAAESTLGPWAVFFEVCGIAAGTIDGIVSSSSNMGAARLFKIDPTKVDAPMNHIARAFAAINGSTVGIMISIVSTIVKTYTPAHYDFIYEVAKAFYRLLVLNNEKKLNALTKNQEAWKSNYNDYVDSIYKKKYQEVSEKGLLEKDTSYDDFVNAYNKNAYDKIFAENGISRINYASFDTWNAQENQTYGSYLGESIFSSKGVSAFTGSDAYNIKKKEQMERQGKSKIEISQTKKTGYNKTTAYYEKSGKERFYAYYTDKNTGTTEFAEFSLDGEFIKILNKEEENEILARAKSGDLDVGDAYVTKSGWSEFTQEWRDQSSRVGNFLTNWAVDIKTGNPLEKDSSYAKFRTGIDTFVEDTANIGYIKAWGYYDSKGNFYCDVRSKDGKTHQVYSMYDDQTNFVREITNSEWSTIVASGKYGYAYIERNKWGQMIDKVKDKFKGVKEDINVVGSAFGDFFGTIGKAVFDPNANNGFREFSDTMVETVADGVSSGFKAAYDPNAKNGFREFNDVMVETVADGVSSAFKASFDPNAKNGFREFSDTMVETVGDWVTGFINPSEQRVNQTYKRWNAITSFFMEHKEFCWVDSDGIRYVANGDEVYDMYNTIGEKIGEMDREDVEAKALTGDLHRGEMVVDSTIKQAIHDTVNAVRDAWITDGGFIGRAITKFLDERAEKKRKEEEAEKRKNNYIDHLKDGQVAWVDYDMSYYMLDASGEFYDHYSPIGIITESNIDIEFVNNRIRSGFLVKGTPAPKSWLDKFDNARKEFRDSVDETFDTWMDDQKYFWSNLFGGSGSRVKNGGSGTRTLVGGGRGKSRKITGGGRGTDSINGVPYYSQSDSAWSSNKYGNDGATMDDTGCGPTAMSMVASKITGQSILPTETASLAEMTGDRDSTGTNWNFIDKASSAYGINTNEEFMPSSDFISSELKNGKPMILSGASGNGKRGGRGETPYTDAGHYVVATGIDSNGNVDISDPRGKSYSKKYKLNDIVNKTGKAWSFDNGGGSGDGKTQNTYKYEGTLTRDSNGGHTYKNGSFSRSWSANTSEDTVISDIRRLDKLVKKLNSNQTKNGYNYTNTKLGINKTYDANMQLNDIVADVEKLQRSAKRKESYKKYIKRDTNGSYIYNDGTNSYSFPNSMSENDILNELDSMGVSTSNVKIASNNEKSREELHQEHIAYLKRNVGKRLANFSKDEYIGDGNTLGRGQCTWYAEARAFERSKWKGLYDQPMGDGGSVYYKAKGKGYDTGTEIADDSLLSINTGGSYGHVVYIEGYDEKNDLVYWSEANGDGNANGWYRDTWNGSIPPDGYIQETPMSGFPLWNGTPVGYVYTNADPYTGDTVSGTTTGATNSSSPDGKSSNATISTGKTTGNSASTTSTTSKDSKPSILDFISQILSRAGKALLDSLFTGNFNVDFSDILASIKGESTNTSGDATIDGQTAKTKTISSSSSGISSSSSSGTVVGSNYSGDDNRDDSIKSGAKGVDISYCQPGCDYVKMKKDGIDFAMIKIGEGGDITDNLYETHYAGCVSAGIHVGGYYFCATTTVEGAKNEAKRCIELLKGKKFDMPIAYDVEYQYVLNLGIDTVSAICDAFCSTLKNAGYLPMIYGSEYSTFDNVSAEVKNRYDLWIANWGSNKPKHKNCTIWQYAGDPQRTIVNGCPNVVDMDRCYRDYPTEIMNKGLNGYEKGEKNSTNKDKSDKRSDSLENVSAETNNSSAIMVGDSRMVGIFVANGGNYTSSIIGKKAKDGNTFIAEEGKGLLWFKSKSTIETIAKYAKGNTSSKVVIWLGINDISENGDSSSIANVYISQADELSKAIKNKIYFVSVGHLASPDKNSDYIKKFNTALKNAVNESNNNNIKYIDLNSWFSEKIKSGDIKGASDNDYIHYSIESYRLIYSKILSEVGANGGGSGDATIDRKGINLPDLSLNNKTQIGGISSSTINKNTIPVKTYGGKGTGKHNSNTNRSKSWNRPMGGRGEEDSVRINSAADYADYQKKQSSADGTTSSGTHDNSKHIQELKAAVGQRLADFSSEGYTSKAQCDAGQCTWYAEGRAWERAKWEGLNKGVALGNGQDVVNTVSGLGLPTGSEIADDSLASMHSSSPYGHVVYVEGVDKDNQTVYWSEANGNSDNVVSADDGVIQATPFSEWQNKGVIGYAYTDASNNYVPLGTASSSSSSSSDASMASSSSSSSSSVADGMNFIASVFSEAGRRMTNALFTGELDTDYSGFLSGHTSSSSSSSSSSSDASLDSSSSYSSASSDAAGTVDGNSVKEQVWNALAGYGYSAAAIAGIMGNIERESGFDPGIYAYNGDGGGGLVQWTPWNTKIGAYSQEVKGDNLAWRNDVGLQMEYLHKTMTNSGRNDTIYSDWEELAGMSYDEFKSISDPVRAAEAFEKVYERAGVIAMGDRTSAAQKYYDEFANKATKKSNASTSSSSMPNISSSINYKNYMDSLNSGGYGSRKKSRADRGNTNTSASIKHRNTKSNKNISNIMNKNKYANDLIKSNQKIINRGGYGLGAEDFSIEPGLIDGGLASDLYKSTNNVTNNINNTSQIDPASMQQIIGLLNSIVTNTANTSNGISGLGAIKPQNIINNNSTVIQDTLRNMEAAHKPKTSLAGDSSRNTIMARKIARGL